MIHHFKRATWQLLFWSLLASAIGLTAVRLALPSIGHFKQELTEYVSGMLGAPVSIGRLGTKMRGLTPELLLKNIVVAGTKKQSPVMQLKEIRIRLNLLALLTHRNILPATSIILVGPRLTVQRNPDGSFSVKGLKTDDGQPLWLLQGRHYEMLQSEIVFQDLKRNGKPLIDATVDLAISNAGERHRINAIVKLPPRYGGKLIAAMDLKGNFFNSERLNGKFFVESQQLRTPAIQADFLPSTLRLAPGEANGKLWGRIDNTELTDLQGNIALTVHNPNRPAALQSRFRWRRSGPQSGRWRLDVPHLQVTTEDKTKPVVNSFSIAGDFSLRNWAWSIGHLDLQNAARIGQWFLPEQQAQLISRYRPSGRLDHFTGAAELDNHRYAARGRFAHLAMAQVAEQPGFSGVSGQIDGTQQRGVIRLTAENAEFNYPALFRAELPIPSLQSALTWRQDDNQWLIASPSIKLALPGIHSESKLRLTWPKDSRQPPFLDWQTALTDDDVSRLKTLLPANIMKPVDVAWLDAAFVKGRISQGRILYYGPLGPLNSAVFQTLLDVDGVELNYDPEWPHLTDLKGRVSFLQNKMICEADQGRSGNLNIVKAIVIHPAISASEHLLIDGQVAGALPDALAFLKQTPLNEDLGGLITAIQTRGQTKVTMDLDLALNNQGRTRLDGSAKLRTARLNIKAIGLWLEQINGDLKFNETGVYSDTIAAMVLDRPAAISISRDADKTRIDATGEADVKHLKKQFVMPFWNYVQGELAYQLQLDLPKGDHPPLLSIQSDLQGITVNLPKPFAKTAEQSKPLALAFTLLDGLLLPIALNYDQQFKAVLKLDTRNQTLHAGQLLLGKGAARQPTGNGLSLEINRDKLELAELGGFSALQSPDSGAPSLNQLIIHSANALWRGSSLGFFNLNLNHEGNYWLGDIDSKIAQGKVQLPVDFNPDGTLSFNLHLLDLSALPSVSADDKLAQKPAAADTSPFPQQLPLFAITSQKTLWQGVDLGRLSAHATRINDGMAVNEASLNGPEQSLAFSGRWQNQAGNTTTAVHGSLTAAKTGQLLRRLSITDDFKETEGKLDFALTWQAPPYHFQAASLSGALDVMLKNGRILSIEPGFGRLLGLVAMAQWDKRLKLDFRDVYEEGLSFNTLQGNFRINNGVAHTDNLLIDAIPAKISITGDADLSKKTLDHIVQVIPKSADAVPIAGTIVDNVLNLASRTLTGESGEGLLLRSEYYAKGSWRNIELIPTHEHDGLLPRTWDALTDFPWARPKQPTTE